MAYRFLLEVPDNLSGDANVAVATAGDAQVLVDRPAHGLGYDQPYANLTVAAHSLKVLDTIYAWAAEVGATRPDSRTRIGLVLHSGQRIGLHDIDQRSLVAAVRRDQPWVERTLPKIGDHERVTFASGETQVESPLPPEPSEELAVSSITDANLIDAEDEVTVNGRTYAVIRVMNLDKAERFYQETLGLAVVRRMRQESDGEWIDLPDEYDQAQASHTAQEADLTFMQGGALNVALSRAGRAAYLDYDTIRNDVQIRMDPAAANRLRALVLMRGYTLLASTGPAFAFRDPFGAVWDVHPHAR